MNAKHVIVTLSCLLFVSLAANFFFIGLMAGSAVQVDGNGTGQQISATGGEAAPTMHARLQDAQLRKTLSEDDKRVLARAMGAVKDELQAAKTQLRDARRAVHAAMRADPFDAAALREALQTERAQQTQILDLINRTRGEAAAAMSPDGRAALLSISGGMGKQEDGVLGKLRDYREKRRQRTLDRLGKNRDVAPQQGSVKEH